MSINFYVVKTERHFVIRSAPLEDGEIGFGIESFPESKGRNGYYWPDWKNEKLLFITTPDYELEKMLAELKGKLASTDYQAIKYAEGWMTEEEYAPIRIQRQEWRDEINRLEAKQEPQDDREASEVEYEEIVGITTKDEDTATPSDDDAQDAE